MQFIIDVPDNKASFFLELAKNLKFVKIAPTTVEEAYEEPTKEQLKAEIRQAVNEVNLAKQGKLQLPTLEEFLNEL